MKNVILFCIIIYVLIIYDHNSWHSVTAGTVQGSEDPYQPAEPGEVIISEIMADPTPQVYLPACEYLEITSVSVSPVSLEGWYLMSGSSKYYFPSVQIAGNDYIILCHVADTPLLSKYGKTAGFKSFPALNDDGKCIVLCDKNGRMIHGVDYTRQWYGDELKSGGGWSLELTDLSYPFFYEGNWRASVAPEGGTPGKINSVRAFNPDSEFEGIVNTFPADTVLVKVSFSEPVKNLESLSHKIRVNDLTIKSITSADPLRREFIMELNGFIGRNKIYSLSLPGEVTDYAGNNAVRRTFEFGIPYETIRGDVMFNELLFNPLPGDDDYIEIVNISDKIIDVSDIYVSSKNTVTGRTATPVGISAANRCLLPGEYYAFTTGRSAIVSRYFSSRPDRVFQVSKMPSMPDTEGTLVLMNRSLVQLDEVYYNEKMHNIFIRGREGIAIEKISPAAISSFSGNWHSASEVSGWGTPGRENSVFSSAPVSGKVFSLSSTRISPDNDGYEDILIIKFNTEGEGNVTNVTVYDETGMPVKKVAVNFFLGGGGEIFWDGTSDDGSLLPQGIYIIFATVFNDRGKSQSWKMACALLRK